MSREISQKSRRRRDKEVWSESWRHMQAGERARESREKDKKEAANSFGVSLEGARQKRGRQEAEQKQSGIFRRRHVWPKINKSSLSQHLAHTQ